MKFIKGFNSNMDNKKKLNDIKQLFELLEQANIEYAVLRSADKLVYDEHYLDDGHDIDIICSSRDFNRLIEVVSYEKGVYSGEATIVIEVDGKAVSLDVFCPGSGPYGYKWELDMIRERKKHKSGICYVLSDEHYYYSLLYHSVCDYGRVLDKYVEKLNELKEIIKIDKNSVISLNDYLRENDYGDVSKRHNHKKEVAKKVLVVFGNIAIAVFVATMLLCLAYALPIKPIDKHVAESAQTMQNEGAYPILIDWITSKLDNVTDAVMMLEASVETEESILVKTMYSHLGIINGLNDGFDIMVTHYIDGVDYDRIGSYHRYWHGYLVFLKPLLELMDYQHIRMLNALVQLMLVVCICFMLNKRKTGRYILPVIISYFMLMPYALALSLQFSSCFYVFSFTICVLLLLNYRVEKYAYLVFLYAGMMTSFLDFLTYPISTFGLPAIFFLVLMRSSSRRDMIKALIANGICWCVGYGTMWASKWIIGSIVTGENIIQNAASVFAFRTSSLAPDSVEHISRVSAVIENYRAFLRTPITLFLLAYFAVMGIKCIKMRKISKGFVMNMVPFCMIAAAPVVWYIFASEHSIVHYWYTNKACSVTVLALMFGFVKNLYYNPQ